LLGVYQGARQRERQNRKQKFPHESPFDHSI
jgi:hypothetical protein